MQQVATGSGKDGDGSCHREEAFFWYAMLARGGEEPMEGRNPITFAFVEY